MIIGLIFVPLMTAIGLLSRAYVNRLRGKQAVKYFIGHGTLSHSDFDKKLLEIFKKQYGSSVVDVSPVFNGMGDIEERTVLDCVVRFTDGSQQFKTLKRSAWKSA